MGSDVMMRPSTSWLLNQVLRYPSTLLGLVSREIIGLLPSLKYHTTGIKFDFNKVFCKNISGNFKPLEWEFLKSPSTSLIYLKTCTPTILRVLKRYVILDLYLEHVFLEKLSLQNYPRKESVVDHLTNHKEIVCWKRTCWFSNEDRREIL